MNEICSQVEKFSWKIKRNCTLEFMEALNRSAKVAECSNKVTVLDY